MPHVAESFEANDDATVWTFKIKDGLDVLRTAKRSLPSTFADSWERRRRLRR